MEKGNRELGGKSVEDSEDITSMDEPLPSYMNGAGSYINGMMGGA
jgi:hypothetical protein